MYHGLRLTNCTLEHNKYENNKLEGLHQKPAQMERIR